MSLFLYHLKSTNKSLWFTTGKCENVKSFITRVLIAFTLGFILFFCNNLAVVSYSCINSFILPFMLSVFLHLCKSFYNMRYESLSLKNIGCSSIIAWWLQKFKYLNRKFLLRLLWNITKKNTAQFRRIIRKESYLLFKFLFNFYFWSFFWCITF